MAWFSTTALPAMASTLETCHQALSDIRDIALDSSLGLQERLDQIVAIVDGEIGPLTPSIVGDFAGTIPAGETWRITGDVNLTGDLIVEGTLEGVDTFTIEGNGHQILVQNGGRLNLAGKSKTGWVRWGDPASGWSVGDRLAVAPMVVGDYTVREIVWDGSWGSRPVGTEDFTMPDGSVVRPEVANLDRSAVIRNVSRIMIHMGAGVQTLRHLAIRDSGVADTAGFYSLHFHKNGDTVRGSLVEGVVIEDSRFRSFVPHASHGVTLRDCAAVNSNGDGFWWDLPAKWDDTSNNSDDSVWDKCLVLGALGGYNASGFTFPGGLNNRATNIAAAAVFSDFAPHTSAGFLWHERTNGNIGGNIWLFEDAVAHNCNGQGLFSWNNRQASDLPGIHFVDRLIAFNNDSSDVRHGAYVNNWHYRDSVVGKLGSIAVSGDVLFDNVTASVMWVGHHNVQGNLPVIYRSCDFGEVVIQEGTGKSSIQRFEDCALSPTDFEIRSINPDSRLEIVEAGAVVHEWINGSWV